MPSGGARARSGPPPDPNALRRRHDAGEWTLLPADGREGDPPTWPLVKASKRELALWRDLWAMPQATVWERYGQVIEVALYVRNLAAAELPGASVALGTLVRQMADSLGLTTPGLRANRWRVGEPAGDPAGAGRPGPSAPVVRRSSSRTRLKVVPGDGDSD